MDGETAPTLEEVCSKTFLFLTAFRRGLGKIDMREDWVRQRLLEIFAEQKKIAERHPRVCELYQKAEYLLVVTADGVILTSEWPGRERWSLLEAEFYGTNVGGEVFFEKLRNDPAFKDEALLEIFYLCLSVGFAGKYYGNPAELAEIRHDLFLRLKDVPRDLSEQVTPKVYQETLGEDFTSMPVINALRLGIVLLGLLLLLSVGAYVLYVVNTGAIAEDAKSLALEGRLSGGR